MICGNLSIWKGSETTNLVSIAITKIFSQVLQKWNFGPVFTMCCGLGKTIGEKIVHDERLKLISFTGSCQVGRYVSGTVHARFGRTILELGGNNAMIVMEDGDQNLALSSAVFAAVGTAGQRCTSLRRLILHEKIYDDFLKRMIKAYETIKIGDPFDSETLCGPVHSKLSIKTYQDCIENAKKQGGKVLYGAEVLSNMEGNYLKPTIIEIDSSSPLLKNEYFVPILFVMKCTSYEEALKLNNSVPQGLSSALFTKDMQKVFKWTGPNGSYCGLVNVNVSTSGAEIGGAFGGEKETGGGREAGGDAWKQ
jgi:aldehyde dehydrogenase family 7 protein A1